MCKDPVEDIRQTKARLAAIFSDLETYMEFMMQRQEKRMKQGVKYADFCTSRNRNPKRQSLNSANRRISQFHRMLIVFLRM